MNQEVIDNFMSLVPGVLISFEILMGIYFIYFSFVFYSSVACVSVCLFLLKCFQDFMHSLDMLGFTTMLLATTLLLSFCHAVKPLLNNHNL